MEKRLAPAFLIDRLKPNLRRFSFSSERPGGRYRAAALSHDPVRKPILQMSSAPETASTNRTRRVLVVEDDAINLTVLRLALEKWGYQIFPAHDVKGAQDKFRHVGADHFDCVISDYWLPDQTGLDFLKWLKIEEPSLASVMLTTDNDRSLITESLRLGVVDFLEKPVNIQKLLVAIDTASLQTARRRHLQKSESAVEGLGRIQRWMVRTVETQLIELCFHPKFEAGGDFLGRFQINSHIFCCLLTDVSGHDPQAAYISSYFHGIFRGMSLQGSPLKDIFRSFNQFLLKEWNQEEKLRQGNTASTSVAAVALLVDSDQHTVSVLTNGAPVPVQVQPDGRAKLMGEMGGPPLGWFPDIEICTTQYSTDGGGTIYLWTDGLGDLADTFGVHPLSLAFALQEGDRNGAKLPILKSANDDILFAAVLLPENDPGVGLLQPIILEMYAGNQTPEIDEIAAGWERNFRLAIPQMGDAAEHDILLASREAVLNALKHGCQGRAEKTVRFQASYHRLDHFIRIWVEDPGPGHDFDVNAHAREMAHSLIDEHRGLICIMHLARKVQFERGGATVILDFPL